MGIIGCTAWLVVLATDYVQTDLDDLVPENLKGNRVIAMSYLMMGGALGSLLSMQLLLLAMLALGGMKKNTVMVQKFSPEQSSGPSCQKTQTTHKICNLRHDHDGIDG